MRPELLHVPTRTEMLDYVLDMIEQMADMLASQKMDELSSDIQAVALKWRARLSS